MVRRRLFGAAVVALALGAAGGQVAAGGAPPAGDPVAGKAIYGRCLACHALAYDRTGPRHCGLFGRHAGTVPGFAYSEAMKRSKIVWGESTLQNFLANPMGVVPGTSMGYSGIPNRNERVDLIAYLRYANKTPECGRK